MHKPVVPTLYLVTPNPRRLKMATQVTPIRSERVRPKTDGDEPT